MRKSRTIDAPAKASSRRQQVTRGARGGKRGGGGCQRVRESRQSQELCSLSSSGVPIQVWMSRGPQTAMGPKTETSRTLSEGCSRHLRGRHRARDHDDALSPGPERATTAKHKKQTNTFTHTHNINTRGPGTF